MRLSREFFKPKSDGVYLHVYNHTVAMEFDQLPLTQIEKEVFQRTLERHLHKYNIDIISLVVMSNHYHMIIYCHAEKFTPEQAVKAYAKFHNSKKELEEDDWRVQNLIKHSGNFSEFMREVQMSFSKWFNKSRPYKRQGALWQDRFQCQLIQSDAYLWGCLQYIELNPVRAKMCKDPADYKHSTFGQWSQGQNHPYQANFIKHILSLAGNQTKLDEFKKYMHAKMKLSTINDQLEEVDDKPTLKLLEKSKQKELSKLKDFDFQVITFKKIDWKSNKIIGSEEYIHEHYRQWEYYQQTA